MKVPFKTEENLWQWMKVQLRVCHPTNLEELKVEIKRLWVTRLSDSEYLWGLLDSMPHRLEEVIACEGASTHY